jgi:hypothetical protein
MNRFEIYWLDLLSEVIELINSNRYFIIDNKSQSYKGFINKQNIFCKFTSENQHIYIEKKSLI